MFKSLKRANEIVLIRSLLGRATRSIGDVKNLKQVYEIVFDELLLREPVISISDGRLPLLPFIVAMGSIHKGGHFGVKLKSLTL